MSGIFPQIAAGSQNELTVEIEVQGKAAEGNLKA